MEVINGVLTGKCPRYACLSRVVAYRHRRRHLYSQNLCSLSSSLAPLEFITVDPDRLEMTPWPFKVIRERRMPGKEGDGTEYNGFKVFMRAEYRDIMGSPKQVDPLTGKVLVAKIKPFPFKCLLEGRDKLKVVAPLLSASDRGNDDEAIRRSFTDDSNFMESLDLSRNDFIARQGGVGRYQKAKKHYILSFPPVCAVKLDGDVLLANKVKDKQKKKMVKGELKLGALNLNCNISRHDDTGWEYKEIDGERYPVFYKEKLPRLYWEVADLNDKSGMTGHQDEEESSDEDGDAVKAMKRMNIS